MEKAANELDSDEVAMGMNEDCLFAAVREGLPVRVLEELVRSNVGWMDMKSKDNDGILHVAVKSGNTPALEYLCSMNGANLQLKNGDGLTPMHLAVAANNTHAIACLFSHGADVNGQDDEGNTPLHTLQMATSSNYDQVLTMLVAFGADVNARNQSGSSPIHYAAYYKSAVELQAMADHLDELEARNDRNFTPLHAAVAGGNLEAVEFLLEKGLDPLATSLEGRTPLHEVGHAHAANNFAKIVALLKSEYGKNMDPRDDEGSTPFMFCVSMERAIDDLQCLIDYGADWRLTKNNGNGVLHEAVYRGNEDVLRFFLAQWANVNATGIHNATPLICAAFADKNFQRVVSLLVDHGADINAQQNDDPGTNLALMIGGRKERSADDLKHVVGLGGDWRLLNKEKLSILHIVAKFGTAEKLKYVLELQPELNGQCIEGSTPLHQLLQSKFEIMEKLELLLNTEGLDINVVDSYGNNAILAATFQGLDVNVLEALVNHGANWKAINNFGFSVMHLAIERGKLTNIQYFLQLGADLTAESACGHQMAVCRLVFTNPDNLEEILEFMEEQHFDFNVVDDHGNSFIHWIANSNGGKATQKLLGYLVQRNGGNDCLNGKDANGLSLLHLSAKNDNLEALRFFTEEGGMQVGIEGRDGVAHCAIVWGSLRVLDYLVQKFGLEPFKANFSCCGKSLLKHVKCAKKNQAEVKAMLMLEDEDGVLAICEHSLAHFVVSLRTFFGCVMQYFGYVMQFFATKKPKRS